MARPVTWTDDRRRRFMAAYLDHSIPIADIAQRFGVTLDAAAALAKRLGVRRRRKYKPRRRRAGGHPLALPGPWRRRCACGAIFTVMTLDEPLCERCR